MDQTLAPTHQELLQVLVDSRRSKHRPAPMALPSDPAAATATALAVINGGNVGAIDRAAAIEGLTARVANLTKTDGRGALAELAQHLPVLHSLFLRMATEAATAPHPDHRAKLLRMSLAAQQNYARTAALLVTLQQGNTTVIMDGSGEDDL